MMAQTIATPQVSHLSPRRQPRAPGSGSPSENTSRSAGGIKTDPAALGDIELAVWDQEVRGSQNDALVALNEAFQKYPNITIKRVSQSNDDLQQQIALALSCNDVPDVAQVNNAHGDMGNYVAAGQLTNLELYAKAYGWGDRFVASVLSKCATRRTSRPSAKATPTAFLKPAK